LTAETAQAPATHEEVEARYRELRAQHQSLHDSLANGRSTVLRLLLGTAGVVVYLAFQSLHTAVSPWLFVAGFVAIVAFVWISMNRQTKVAKQQRILGFYDRSIERASGTDVQSGRTGTDPGQTLRPEGHLYEHDLDLLGPNSLFGLLATVRTGPGERGLARYLLDPASHEETLQRQEAVKELLPQTALREQIAILGATRFHQISASFFDEWLDEEAPIFHPAFRIILIITAIANVILITLGLIHFRTWGELLPNLALVLLVQAAISSYLRPRVLPLLQGGARLELNIRLLADGLAVLQSTDFTCPKLKALQRSSLEPAGAVKLLKDLVSSLAIVEQRSKEYFLVLSLLLAAGTQAAISIATWKRRNASAMREWLNAWAEFEALNAIATYTFEHPEDAWPELLPADYAPTFEATSLGHPLLAGSVTNDVSLGIATRFFLISGSNMSGKSTLLRSIGINAVLAYAGARVRAQSLRLTPLRLGASLALTDSLAEGRSKFLAEVERLSAIVAASHDQPTLFLVDEIFSGTNSADRRTAAGAVLTRLLANGAIGALSTHDLALTELVTDANTGLNVHMASPDPEDPLAFDYKLKPGVNTTSNALAIVRMMGL
jgi:predicted ATPase